MWLESLGAAFSEIGGKGLRLAGYWSAAILTTGLARWLDDWKAATIAFLAFVVLSLFIGYNRQRQLAATDSDIVEAFRILSGARTTGRRLKANVRGGSVKIEIYHQLRDTVGNWWATLLNDLGAFDETMSTRLGDPKEVVEMPAHEGATGKADTTPIGRFVRERLDRINSRLEI